MWGWVVRRRASDDRGASAVEFALVVPVLIVLVLGIVDYGLFFSDRLAVKQGIREGARDAVVLTGDSCDMDCLAGNIKREIGAVGGTTYVYVDIVETDETDPPLGDGWLEGNELRVCAVVMESSLTGFTPLPERVNDAMRMRIEHDTGRAGSGQTGLPPGDWDWCLDEA
jgi:hypothetical protein